MNVILKKDHLSKKFGITFPKGMAMKYSKDLFAVEHPRHPNVWLTVEEKDFEIAKNYVIMGDNNIWYSTTGEVTKEGLEDAIKEVKEGIKNKTYDDNDANELHVFETADSWTIEIEN